jgi:hypothetical protein
MISAAVNSDLAALADRLAAKARTLAEAQAENAVLARRSDPVRWRRAALLWPLFAKAPLLERMS